MTEVLLLIVSLGLVLACGAFVAAEFSFVTVDRSTVERAAEEGDAGARGVQDALRSLSTQLSGAQLGITLTNLLIGFMAEPAIAELIDGPLEDARRARRARCRASRWPSRSILATGVTMVLGELVPKNLAIARPLGDRQGRPGLHARLHARCSGRSSPLFNGIGQRAPAPPRHRAAGGARVRALARGADVARRAARPSRARSQPDTATLLQRSLAFGDRRAARHHDAAHARWSRCATTDPVIDGHRGRPGRRASRASRCSARAPTSRGHRARQARGAGAARATARDVPVAEVMVPPVLVPSSRRARPAAGRRCARAGCRWRSSWTSSAASTASSRSRTSSRRSSARSATSTTAATRRSRPRAEGRWMLSGLLRPDEIARHDRASWCPPEDERLRDARRPVGRPARPRPARRRRRRARGPRRRGRAQADHADGAGAWTSLRVDRLRMEVGPPEHDDDDDA